MTTKRFRVSVNGFVCSAQTWDDSLNRDGKADEVFIAVGYKRANKSGTVLESVHPDQTPVMGDAWNRPNRIEVGSAWGNRGGIISGDSYPTTSPWIRSRPLQDDRNWPPYKVWEGNLTQGEDVVFLTPTIWEWDEGKSFWNGLIDWFSQVDRDLGPKAKEIISGNFPAGKWIFEAAELGVQALATAAGMWSVFGEPMTRPIGTERHKADPKGISFNPYILPLTYDRAELLSTTENPNGKGIGILSLRYIDDPHLWGDYSIYLQVEHADSGDPLLPELSVVRESSRPEVYVIVGDAKFWIPDPPTLFRLYGGWAAVRVVPDGTLTNVSRLPKEGTILREEHAPYVWRIEGAHKRHIATPTVLFRYGGWSMVRVVPDNSLAMIPNGAPIN